jgi:hypothetical protein
MQYFRLLLIVRLNSRWFYARYACDDYVCTYLIMFKQLSAGAGVRQELSRPPDGSKGHVFEISIGVELYIILTYAVLREFY